MLMAIQDAQVKDIVWAACGTSYWIPMQEVNDYTKITNTNVPLQI